MNREELRNLVISNTRRSDKSSLINSAINLALTKLSSEFLWNDLLTEATATLVVDATSISLASDYVRGTEFRVIDGLTSWSIEIRSKNWLSQRWPDPSALASSDVAYGYIQGQTLYLIPPSSEALPLNYSYHKLHPGLTDDVTNISITGADEAIIAYSTYYTFKSIENHESATLWLADYRVAVKDLRRIDHDPVVEHIADPYGRAGSYGRQERPWTNSSWLDPFRREV